MCTQPKTQGLSLHFGLFIRTKLEYLEEFGDTLQFYFEDLGLKRMKMMKKRGNRE